MTHPPRDRRPRHRVRGPGGVGKTDYCCRARLARGAGRAACMRVTIDPARRLADALGLRRRGQRASQVSPPADAEALAGPAVGRHGLDAQTTFDDLVEPVRDRPRSGRSHTWPTLSTATSRRQCRAPGYMEKSCYERQESGAFDLIVVDTPPASMRRFPGSAPSTSLACSTTGCSASHDADESGPAGVGDRGAAHAADDRQGRRRSSRCGHDRLFHPVRRHGGGL